VTKKAEGYSVCCCVFADNGLLLRVLPHSKAAKSWIRKHFGPDGRRKYRTFRSKRQVSLEFDRQMQLGLTTLREINDLIWYAGVSTSWEGPKAKTQKKSDTIKA